MITLVVGASGATGKRLVAELLKRNHHVRAIVRNADTFPEQLKTDKNLNLIQGNLLELSDVALTNYTKDCEAIASCLGHNLTWKGIYGQPRKLVTDAVKRLTAAAIANQPEHPVKYVLMNTTGNRNKDLNEKVSWAHKTVVGLLRNVLPPQLDNEQAAEFLRAEIGQSHKTIEWAAVRPDGLIEEDAVSAYSVHPSPTRDPIFDAGKTSRINVAHFMADLITEDSIWQKWKGQMPVIYNAEEN